jgi:hypothetical protein
MFCIEGILAQTHTPEESIVCEKFCLPLTRTTISKARGCNNPQMGDFFYNQIFAWRRIDHIADQNRRLIRQTAQGKSTTSELAA